MLMSAPGLRSHARDSAPSAPHAPGFRVWVRKHCLMGSSSLSSLSIGVGALSH